MHLKEWRKITKDPFILDCIQGCKINFLAEPIQIKKPHQINFNHKELQCLKTMLKEFIETGVIAPCSIEENDFINTVFLREKKDSTPDNPKYRMILNMKPLNKQYVKLTHHKINSLQTCCELLEPNGFMASIDLKNAFHTVPMHQEFTKFLKFVIEGQAYKYLVLPMGFRDSPRLFCKILKPVLANLRKKGFVSAVYIDDFFLTAPSYMHCHNNVTQTLNLLKSLGFEISDKSALEPSQTLIHLGFVINSLNMTVYLHEAKKLQISELILKILKAECITVQQLASIIGTLVAAFPGVLYGPLYYRQLELLKISELSISYNYKRKIVLNALAREELKWWLTEGINSFKPISFGNPEIIIQTDASTKGWGALVLGSKARTQGLWSRNEQELHINVLELKAAYLGMQALCDDLYNCSVQIQMDNQTAVTYVNNMGGTHSLMCNSFAKTLIIWCKNRHIWVSACHIAGVDNNKADLLSREINDDIEWKLNERCFQRLCDQFGTPDIDVFASRINHQLPKYFSYHPDSKALAINAFAHKWDFFAYIFPPFNLIPRVLRKLKEDKTGRVILVVPKWIVATWYPILMEMLLQPPIHLGNNPKNLVLSHNPNKTHPLCPNLKLMGCYLSGQS